MNQDSSLYTPSLFWLQLKVFTHYLHFSINTILLSFQANNMSSTYKERIRKPLYDHLTYMQLSSSSIMNPSKIMDLWNLRQYVYLIVWGFIYNVWLDWYGTQVWAEGELCDWPLKRFLIKIDRMRVVLYS